MAGRIGLQADLKDVTLAPGETSMLRVTITNTGFVVDAFELSVRGLDEGWYTVTPASVSLFPKAKAVATIQLHPPAQYGINAGDYQFEFFAKSRDAEAESATLPMRLTIASTGDVRLALEPQRIVSRKGIFQLQATYNGNIDKQVVLRPTDDSEALEFSFSPFAATPLADVQSQQFVSEGRPVGQLQPTRSTLETEWTAPGTEAAQGALTVSFPPATQANTRVTVQARKRTWFGREIHYPFTILATPPGVEYSQNDVRRTTGELVYRPVFAFAATWPLRLRMALLILIPLCLFLILLFLILRPLDNKNNLTAAQQTQTAEANGVSQTQTAAAAARAQTMTAVAKANGGDQAAANATLTALAGGGGAGSAAAQTQTAQAIAAQTQTAIAAAGGPLRIVNFGWTSVTNGSAQAAWEVQPSNGVTATINETPVPLVGTMTVDATKDRSFTLKATNGKDEVSRSIGALLLFPPQVTLFTAEPTETCPGCPITLRWQVDRALKVSIDGTPVPAPSGSMQVTPSGPTQYVLVADNNLGSNAASVNVTINPNAPSPTPVPATLPSAPSPTP